MGRPRKNPIPVPPPSRLAVVPTPKVKAREVTKPKEAKEVVAELKCSKCHRTWNMVDPPTDCEFHCPWCGHVFMRWQCMYTSRTENRCKSMASWSFVGVNSRIGIGHVCDDHLQIMVPEDEVVLLTRGEFEPAILQKFGVTNKPAKVFDSPEEADEEEFDEEESENS